ncbi:MAG TPA: hypothetical protein VNP04_30610 [Alphaproteobacteria bacterium]|nr:hypothetical protein [Alphaproteobacteria bacterium]
MSSGDTRTPPPWQFSAAEIHFLYWFIQGSIMNPETRRRLRRAWGFCERHMCGFMAVEAAFLGNFFHGPALLYEDLMGRAMRAFSPCGPWQLWRLRWRLRARGPCLMCEIGLGPTSPSLYAPAEVVAQGRRLEPLQAFAASLRHLWEPYICGRCAGQSSPVRCRRHLLVDGGAVDLARQRAVVRDIVEHVAAYAHSFRFECRGTETDADRAGFVGALGWCSGWRTWLAIADSQPGHDLV